MKSKEVKIIILVDYRNQFWLKSDYKEANFDIPLLCKYLMGFNYEVESYGFDQIDFKHVDYKGTFIIYQSTEDPNHFYNSFIEDCLLGLKLKGAILIPEFEFFRAHDNKVFMEILRDINDEDSIKHPKSTYYGSFEEYNKNVRTESRSTKVFKLSSGAQSKNVRLLKSPGNFIRIPKKYSRSFHLYYFLIDQIKPFWTKRYPNYKKKSHHRRKFIIQEFIADLEGDFKVLVYGSDYYILSRKIRKDDFRASGSGLFTFTKNVPNGILDFAKKCFEAFHVPFMGLDIAEKDGCFYLIEFQFVHFGNYTLEKSPFHFQFKDSGWDIVETSVILEEKFAKTIHEYIKSSF